ncbi:hypothetical protein GGE65_008147 [Skermanella aerolata]|uniref:hypothetical protein n=1 Tax=Skermanella aerolata TaxID=393310 RepID=UPI003D22F5ED
MPRRPIYETMTAEAAKLELMRRVEQERAHAAAYHEKQTGSGKVRYSRYVPAKTAPILDKMIGLPPALLAVFTELADGYQEKRKFKGEIIAKITEYQTKGPLLFDYVEPLAPKPPTQLSQVAGHGQGAGQ